MRIQNNIPALNTYRQLGINNLNQAKSTEKLSSGYRINRAADDASGLSISEKMRAQIRGLAQASANSQDGISLIQAAEGALQETHSILQRMRELAVKAANDINETEDRNAIQAEINQLTKEVDRIAYTTEFNKKTLLDGSLQTGYYATKMLAGNAVTAGVHIDQAVAASIVNGGASVDGIYTISVATAGVAMSKTYSYDLTGLKAGDTVMMTIGFSNAASVPNGQAMCNVPAFTYVATGNAAVDNAAFINGLKDSLSKVITDYKVSTEGNSITFTAVNIGAAYASVNMTATVSGAATTTAAGAMLNTGSVVSHTAGVDASITIQKNSYGTTAISTSVVTTAASAAAASGSFVNNVFKDAKFGITFEIQDLTKKAASIVEIKTGKDLALQVGANNGMDQAIRIGVQSLSAAGLGVDNMRVDTHVSAQASIAAIEKGIQTVSSQRSALGAVQNRLEHTVSNLDTVGENIQAAESRIRDVDMAKEMMAFTKNNVLSQAATAMLAQANQAPQTVLQLLR